MKETGVPDVINQLIPTWLREGVITHDCMANGKFAEIVFYDFYSIIRWKILDPTTFCLKPVKMRNVYILHSHVNAFMHIIQLAMILQIT